MKKVVAFLKPFKLEAVLERLPQVGIDELLITEVRGYGRQKGHLELYRDHEYEFTFLPKARLEIYCDDAQVEPIIAVLFEHARTGRIGDGKILVSEIEQDYDW